MKPFIAGFLLMALPSFGQVAMMALDDIPGTTEVCVTNWGPFIVTGLSDKATTQFVNQAVAPLSARLDAVDTALDGGTNNWNTAYSWGNHVGLYRVIGWVPSWGDLTDIPQDFPPSTHEHDYTTITNPPWLEEYTETDPVAMAALAGYQSAAYWPPNATASSWFTFTTNSGAITITSYNIDGGTAVIIPDYINGLPVTTIGANAFIESGVTSIGGAGNVVTVEDYAFNGCTSLSSVLLPQAQTVGDYAFVGCESLTSLLLPQVQTVGYAAFDNCTSLSSVSLPQAQTVGYAAFSYCFSLASLYFTGDAPTIGDDIFAYITPNQVTNYVTNPQATGWGDTLGGMPVVRLPLYGDKIYQAGELVATTGHVAQVIAAMPVPDLSDHPTFSQVAASNALPYTAWTGTVTPVNGTATVSIAHGNMPVLVTAAPTVLQLDATGYGTAGVSRVSLSYYTGTNALTFATNVINYAETPTVDTNGWNTLLIRRVSNGAWKGVGL